MLVLGIDPGTIRMGYGVVEAAPELKGNDCGVIAMPSSMPLEKRLFQLYTHVQNLISIFKPDAIAVEKPFVGKGERRFAGSAMAIGQAQALVLIGAAGNGIPVFSYSPAQVKLSVADYGAATKEQMQQIITATLGLDKVPESDAADALSVALCHIFEDRSAVALGKEIAPGYER